jgi:hypothetical protein
MSHAPRNRAAIALRANATTLQSITRYLASAFDPGTRSAAPAEGEVRRHRIATAFEPLETRVLFTVASPTDSIIQNLGGSAVDYLLDLANGHSSGSDPQLTGPKTNSATSTGGGPAFSTAGPIAQNGNNGITDNGGGTPSPTILNADGPAPVTQPNRSPADFRYVLRPGAGWAGPTTQPDAIGAPTARGYSAQSIARWDVVPYQTFDSTFNVGVVAFHMNGIKEVDFSVNGGAWTAIRSMTKNPQTGVFEYTATLRAADFQSGPVEVRAIAVPVVGTPRVLESLPLTASPQNEAGQYAPMYAYVSDLGSDATGAVSADWNTAKSTPFATIGKAAAAIKAKRNALFGQNNVDGGFIRLSPGVHAWDGGGSWEEKTAVNQWLTIESTPGHGPEDTTIRNTAGSGSLICQRLRVRNLRLEQTIGSTAGYIGNTSDYATTADVWLDADTIVGAGRWVAGSAVIGGNWAKQFITDSDISDQDFGCLGITFARGDYVHHIGNDAFQDVPVVINCRADDMDAGSTGWHNDLWQHWGGNDTNKADDNVIVYGLTGTGLTYSRDSHGIFFTQDVNAPLDMAEGMAFVNVSISGPGGVCMWYRSVDHLLWWNVAVSDTDVVFEQPNTPAGPPVLTNFSCKGCDFRRLEIPNNYGDNIDFSGWDSNRFRIGAISMQIGGNTYTAATGTLTSAGWWNLRNSDTAGLYAWVMSGTDAPVSNPTGTPSALIVAHDGGTGTCGPNAFGPSNRLAGDWMVGVGRWPGADIDTRVKGTNARVG